jgi:hypothetical protein
VTGYESGRLCPAEPLVYLSGSYKAADHSNQTAECNARKVSGNEEQADQRAFGAEKLGGNP